jgi:hypothetical protein
MNIRPRHFLQKVTLLKSNSQSPSYQCFKRKKAEVNQVPEHVGESVFISVEVVPGLHVGYWEMTDGAERILRTIKRSPAGMLSGLEMPRMVLLSGRLPSFPQ